MDVIKGDITTLKVDAIVNAANKTLLGGGGVDGAIHRAAGPKLLEECKRIRRHEYPEGLPVGQAVITKGYDLPARFVIHPVGPLYSRTDQSHLLASCFRNSLELAEKKKLNSIAFPAISTGVYGYPKEEAARVAAEVFRNFNYRNITKVIMCLFTEDDRKIFAKELGV